MHNLLRCESQLVICAEDQSERGEREYGENSEKLGRVFESGEIGGSSFCLFSFLNLSRNIVRTTENSAKMSNLETRLFINGEYCSPAAPSASFKLVNPATEEFITEVPIASEADIDRAVEAAEKAQPGWGDAAPHVRMAALHKWADLSESFAKFQRRPSGFEGESIIYGEQVLMRLSVQSRRTERRSLSSMRWPWDDLSERTPTSTFTMPSPSSDSTPISLNPSWEKAPLSPRVNSTSLCVLPTA